MFKKVVSNMLIIIVATIVSFSLAEIGIRLTGSFDNIGQFHFQGRPIPPFEIPTQYTNSLLEEYRLNEDRAFIVYDPQLGWTLKPNYSNDDEGLYINSVGIRASREYDIKLADDTLRIALFGDSYTFDANVTNDETWAQALENELNAQQIKAEVINFGVNGYGMDQAYLRWQLFGKNYQPDIVILALF